MDCSMPGFPIHHQLLESTQTHVHWVSDDILGLPRMGCHFLLQCMKVKSEREVAQSCLTLRDPVDCSLPGSSVHGIFQARVVEWGAIVFSGVPSSSVFIWNHFFLLFVILSPIVTFWRFLNSNFSFAFYIIFLVSSQFWSDFFWHWHYAILHLRFDLTLLYLGSVALSVI